jgi:hypothetical protein
LSPPLMQGSYVVDLWLGDGSEDVDVVEDSITFSVEPMDVYGTGISPINGLGKIFFWSEWKLLSHNE